MLRKKVKMTEAVGQIFWNALYFNFYPIVEATKFESDLIGNTSFQKYAAGLCKEINMIIENSLNDFAPVIADSRDYVNSVTGKEGETAFDAWFAQF